VYKSTVLRLLKSLDKFGDVLRTSEVRQGTHAHVRQPRRRSDASGLAPAARGQAASREAVGTAKPSAFRVAAVGDA